MIRMFRLTNESGGLGLSCGPAGVALADALPSGYDYRVNGRRGMLSIGRYGSNGISLADAREGYIAARKAVALGRSPAQGKQRERRRLADAQNFGAVGKRWFKKARKA